MRRHILMREAPSKHAAYDLTGNRQGAFTKRDPRTTKAERRNKRKRTGR